MRQAELRVRGSGSSRSRAAVEPNAEGGRADADGAPEAGARAGEGPPGGRGVRAVPGPGRAGHGGERDDLRRPPGRRRAARTRMPLPGREGKRGAPRRARSGEGRGARTARRRGRQGPGLRRCRPGGRRAGDPGRAAEAGRGHAGRRPVRRPGPPGTARPVRERPRGRVRRLPGQDRSTRSSARSPSRGPGITARSADTASPRATPGSASPGRPCRPDWPR